MDQSILEPVKPLELVATVATVAPLYPKSLVKKKNLKKTLKRDVSSTNEPLQDVAASLNVHVRPFNDVSLPSLVVEPVHTIVSVHDVSSPPCPTLPCEADPWLYLTENTCGVAVKSTIDETIPLPEADVGGPKVAERLMTRTPSPCSPACEDGQVRLHSADGKVYHEHIYNLRETSGHIRQTCPPNLPTPSDIILTQHSSALDVLLPLLRPRITTLPKTPAAPLIEVLRAIQELDIQTFAAQTWATKHIDNLTHPLSSWALARAFNYPDSIRLALERYFKSDSYHIRDVPDELDLISGSVVLRLVSAKERVVREGQLAIANMNWVSCRHCGSNFKTRTMPESSFGSSVYPTSDATMLPHARCEYFKRICKISTNPFHPEITCETFFELCAAVSGCGYCREKVVGEGGPENRSALRKKLAEILAQALEEAI